MKIFVLVNSSSVPSWRAQTAKWEGGGERKAVLCLPRTLDVYGNNSRQHYFWAVL